MSRSIHLIRGDWQGEPDDFHEAVVESLRHGPRYIQVALELWRLVDRDDRVKEIEEVLSHAYERELPTLTSSEIRELLRLLTDLDESVAAVWLDEKGQVSPERMPEVRKRTRLLHLDDLQGHLGTEGVSEGLADVHGLLKFLRQAIDRGLHVSLD